MIVFSSFLNAFVLSLKPYHDLLWWTNKYTLFFVSRDCSVNISDYRNGQRHDMWLPLQNISTGRVHLALTVLEETETKVSLIIMSLWRI